MPHQQMVFDVGLEIDPDTGLPAYRMVVVTMMRQSGKTIIVFSVELDRGVMWSGAQRIMYTAQTGSDARKKLLEDQKPLLQKSPLARTVRQYYQAQGNEQIVFRNGSRIGLAARSESAGHSFTLNLGIIDEAWDDEDDRREQAMIPAMNTIPDAQLWVVSTQGTDKSTYLNRKTELGREAAETDKGSGIAYFEWSIPEDADIEDPEVWWRCMPALGWTIQPEVVAQALDTMEEQEWRRAFGNQKTTTSGERLITEENWQRVQASAATVDRDGQVCLGIDVHPDRSSGAIVASDGQTIELIDYRTGTTWICERARGIADRFNARFVLDGGGPAASLVPDLEAEGLQVEALGTAEVAAACARLYDAIADKRVVFRTADVFDVAVGGLARRPMGDRFIWARQVSAADITPFMAATLAYAGAAQQPGEVQFIALDD